MDVGGCLARICRWNSCRAWRGLPNVSLGGVVQPDNVMLRVTLYP